MFSASPFRIVLLFAVVAVMSFFTIPWLQVTLFPQARSSTINIRFTMSDSSPEVVEQQVTSVLENALSAETGIKDIRSVSRYNEGIISVTFDQSADFSIKKFEITAILRQLYPHLPANVSFPEVSAALQETPINTTPLLVYTVSAADPPFHIRQVMQEYIIRKLAAINVLDHADISGAAALRVMIRLDNDKCKSYGIATSQVAQALFSKYADSYQGTINGHSGTAFFLHIPSGTVSLDNIRNTTLPDSHLYIKDIATVNLETATPEQYFRINGKNAINLSLYARKTDNTLIAGRELKKAMVRIIQQAPAGYHILLASDDTVFLQQEINKNYRRAFLSIIILTTFLLISYRQWRYIITLLAGLIVNVCFTLLAAATFHIPIHIYTIAGIAIAFGMMIDNAILMLDYYHQHGNRKVLLAILTASLITIIPLLLIFLLPQNELQDLNDFALIIIMALIASVIISLWFTPAVHELLLRRKKNTIKGKKRLLCWYRRYETAILLLSARKRWIFTIMILLFGIPIFLLPYHLSEGNWYSWLYNTTLGNESIRPTIDKYLGGTLRLFLRNINSYSSRQAEGRTTLTIQAALPAGNTAAQMNQILEDFEHYLLTIQGVDKFVTQVISGQYGIIVITFQPSAETSTLPMQLKAQLMTRSTEWSGVDWDIYGAGQGFSNKPADETPVFTVLMKGYNYEELEQQASKLGAKLAASKRVQKINTNGKQYYTDREGKEFALQLFPEKLAMVSSNQYEVIAALREAAGAPTPMGAVIIDNTYYPVWIGPAGSEQFSYYDLLNTPLQVGNNRSVRIKDVGEVNIRNTSAAINKVNRSYIRFVTFEYLGPGEFGARYLNILLEETRKQLPAGYSAGGGNEAGWNNNSGSPPLLLLLFAFILLICGVFFGNLRLPVIILLILPLSFIGPFLAYAVFDCHFDQGGYAAFIMLGGLATNACIYILYDHIQLLKQSRLPYHKTVIKAVFTRSRTILLTTSASCCGLAPFILEPQREDFWFSFAAGAIAGLILCFFLVTWVLPLMLLTKKIAR